MDGVSPWKWTVNCHGHCVGHVISGSHVNHGEIKKGIRQGKQQKEGGLISKLAKEEFFNQIDFLFAFAICSAFFFLRLDLNN